MKGTFLDRFHMIKFFSFGYLDPTYFQGRCATVILRGKPIGKIGVLHPDVVTKFDLNNPCSAFEISVEPLWRSS